MIPQGGPLPVMSRVITPLIGVRTPVTNLFSAIFWGPHKPIHYDRRGPPCRSIEPTFRKKKTPDFLGDSNRSREDRGTPPWNHGRPWCLSVYVFLWNAKKTLRIRSVHSLHLHSGFLEKMSTGVARRKQKYIHSICLSACLFFPTRNM